MLFLAHDASPRTGLNPAARMRAPDTALRTIDRIHAGELILKFTGVRSSSAMYADHFCVHRPREPDFA